MNSETVLSNDAVEQLKYILGGFNTFGNSIDVYSICIKKSLENKMPELTF